MAAIDAFLPQWDVNEVHAIILDIPPERALAAALAAPAAPDVVVRMLMRLRGLPGGGSIEDLLSAIGLEPLARDVDEVVFGGSGKPWRPGSRIESFGAGHRGAVRIVTSFRVEPVSGGRTRLSTETRIAGEDEAGRRAFRRYWRVVGPFSSVIRHRWLAAVRRSVE